MNGVNCTTGCLRQELDENSDYLHELIDLDEEEWHELEPQNQKLLFETVTLFEQDFQSFKQNCGSCDNYKLNGKCEEYENLVAKAKEAIVRIRTYGPKVTESKEEGDNVAQTE